jgi:hypothetical protein
MSKEVYAIPYSKYQYTTMDTLASLTASFSRGWMRVTIGVFMKA